MLSAATLVYFLIISAGPESTSRFRVVFMPVAIIFAVAGWGRRPGAPTRRTQPAVQAAVVPQG